MYTSEPDLLDNLLSKGFRISAVFLVGIRLYLTVRTIPDVGVKSFSLVIDRKGLVGMLDPAVGTAIMEPP